jgi:hypothetical protein
LFHAEAGTGTRHTQNAIDNSRAQQQQLDALEAATSMHWILINALILSLAFLSSLSSSLLFVLLDIQITGNIRM